MDLPIQRTVTLQTLAGQYVSCSGLGRLSIHATMGSTEQFILEAEMLSDVPSAVNIRTSSNQVLCTKSHSPLWVGQIDDDSEFLWIVPVYDKDDDMYFFPKSNKVPGATNVGVGWVGDKHCSAVIKVGGWFQWSEIC